MTFDSNKTVNFMAWFLFEWFSFRSSEKILIGAGETTQQLRALTALAEVLSLAPSIYVVANSSLYLQL